jgi:hypothetical protein
MFQGEEAMWERIHELLLRNLQEVFGGGYPTKRRSAIRELVLPQLEMEKAFFR